MGRADAFRSVVARLVDLRAEFEAQLRAVARIEERLQQNPRLTDANWLALEEVLQRALTEMVANNASIRGVLDEVVADAGAAGDRPMSPRRSYFRDPKQ
jgi:hypothetical protein